MYADAAISALTLSVMELYKVSPPSPMTFTFLTLTAAYRFKASLSSEFAVYVNLEYVPIWHRSSLVSSHFGFKLSLP